MQERTHNIRTEYARVCMAERARTIIGYIRSSNAQAASVRGGYLRRFCIVEYLRSRDV